MALSRWSIRGLVLVLLGALVLAISALAAQPASAHGGPFELTVTPDGAGGLTVSATYTADQHPVEEIIDPVAVATSVSGESVGPVALISSPEGVGIWITEEPFIPLGDWSVTVSTTVPFVATTTVDITVAELAGPAEVEETAEETAATDSGFAIAPLLWIGAIVIVLAIAAASVLLSRRRVVARRE